MQRMWINKFDFIDFFPPFFLKSTQETSCASTMNKILMHFLVVGVLKHILNFNLTPIKFNLTVINLNPLIKVFTTSLHHHIIYFYAKKNCQPEALKEASNNKITRKMTWKNPSILNRINERARRRRRKSHELFIICKKKSCENMLHFPCPPPSGDF